MEPIGNNRNGAHIYSDYGHVASSIKLGLEGLRQHFPGKKFHLVFQPHQINRIVTGRDDFKESMQGYESITIYDIYAAREHLEDLVQKIPMLHGVQSIHELGERFATFCGGTYIDTEADIIDMIEKVPGDEYIIIYSAGDIDFKVRKYLLK